MSVLYRNLTAHERLIEEGNVLMAQGRLAEARKLFWEAHTLHRSAKTAYSLALAEHRAGDRKAAGDHYRQALEFEPRTLDARVNLGILLRETGEVAEALHQHAIALALAPQHGLVLFNAGVSLAAAGLPEVARNLLERCRAIDPASPLVRDALNGLPPALPSSLPRAPAERDPDASQEVRAQAARVRADPRDPAAWTDYGSALLHAGLAEAACDAQRRSLDLSPAFAPAHHNLAAGFQALRRNDEAARSYLCAVCCRPDLIASWRNLAQAYQASGHFERAWDALLTVGLLDPREPHALAEFAEVSRRLGRLPHAVFAMERLKEVWPDNYLVPNNLGSYLLDQGRLDEALACFEEAKRLQPDAAVVHGNIGAVFELKGDFASALPAYRRAAEIEASAQRLGRLIHVAQHQCAWEGLDGLIARFVALADDSELDVPPFTLLAIPGITGAHQLSASRRFAAQSAASVVPVARPAKRTRQGKIRLGYVSSDLYDHATAWLIAEIFELHDRSRFEIFAYSYGPSPEDETRRRLKAGVDRFVDINALSDPAAAEAIAADEIDILIDLKGYTRGSRPGIFAARPCAIQVSHLGFPGTSGAAFMDYLIADEVVIPSALEPHYSETVLRLPHCYQPNDRKRPLPPAPSRAEAGLPEQGFVFASFNNVYKITPQVFDMWCALLAEVAGSVLWILSGNAAANANLRKEAQRRGVAGERLIFAPRAALAEHLARFRLADLFLDSFPCTAHTTASDALWCGVPVVTRIGETFASRVAASTLHAVGLADLVTRDAAAYHALALKLAREPAELARLKAHLEHIRMTCPLFDSRAYTADLERVFEGLMADPSRSIGP